MPLPHLVPFARTPLYFFTACVERRRPILACDVVQSVLAGVWRRSAAVDGWFVGRFVIMPDHVHLLAAPFTGAKSRAAWCQTWKSISSRRITAALQVPVPLWQADTFDHILRSSDSYSAKWDYVANNPVRAGLAKHSSDWPWKGEIHSLAF